MACEMKMTVITRLLRLLLWTGATYPTPFDVQGYRPDIAAVGITRTFAWSAAGASCRYFFTFHLVAGSLPGAPAFASPS